MLYRSVYRVAETAGDTIKLQVHSSDHHRISASVKKDSYHDKGQGLLVFNYEVQFVASAADMYD